ncbi:hypothetical protein [Pseudomonas sp. B28(2017)]|uniref:hypothetical protein n=1 Tax=Pseudomonas sp. B28(2017) TaxID=1981730 RepID=UPI00117AEB3A|nr:hypothetical protein [Pseudomonas sp. B28(2017)]
MTDLAQGHHGKAPGGLFLSIFESVYRFFETQLYGASFKRQAERLEQHQVGGKVAGASQGSICARRRPRMGANLLAMAFSAAPRLQWPIHPAFFNGMRSSAHPSYK